MDQRSGDGRFIGGIKILAINCLKEFSKIQMLDARITTAVNKIIQNSHFKKKVSLEEQKGGGPVSSRKTHRLHDLRQLSSHWRS